MILVTGGAGFIGSNLIAGLNAAGQHEIAVCDWLEDGDKWRNLAKREIAEFIAPDELADFLEANAEAVRAVVHLGAISSTTETDADLIVATNFSLSLRLWEWCAEHQARFIYASSAATYGDGQNGFEDDGSPEALATLRPLNAYGWSKHLFDRRVARLIAGEHPCPPQWVGLKFFNVYGPNEYHKGAMQSVVSQMHASIAEDGRARLFRSHHPDYADGGQKRDFVLVDDCVEVMLWLLENPAVSGLFNMGTGSARSFSDLAAATFGAMGVEARIDFIDTPEEIRARYQYFTEARMDRLRQAGYSKEFTPLEIGVARYVGDFLQQPDPYR